MTARTRHGQTEERLADHVDLVLRCSHQFIERVCGREALQHLRLLAKHRAQSLDEGADHAASALVQRSACRLGVALHRANAENLRKSLGVDLRGLRAELAAEHAG